jgi:spore germination protein GerM/outer membrane protein assembly factor BamB
MTLKFKRKATSFLTLLLILVCACSPPQSTLKGEAPVEPVVSGLENFGEALLLKGSFSIINPETKIYGLFLSSSGRDIFFSSDARSVNMLDDQGHLRWEVFLEGLPISAVLTPDGRLAAVGTDQGKVYCLDNDGHILWEKSFQGQVEQVALAPDGDCLAVSLQEEGGQFKLCLFEQWGTTLRWEKETGPLEDLRLLPEDRLAYLEKNEEESTLVLLEEGKVFWQAPASQTAFSENGGFVALFNAGFLNFYQLEQNSPPRLLWTKPTDIEVSSLILTEKGKRLLAYSTFPGTGNNLFVFNQEGTLLWEKKIPGGSLLQTSRHGEKIVASSWQEYSENFSKLLIFDSDGKTLQELEVAIRIEKLAASREGNTLALAGNDGHIFILDLADPNASPAEKSAVGGDAEQQGELYRPAVFQRTAGEYYLTLYFYDEHALHLIPVSRKVKNTPELLQTAVNELVKGPSRFSGLSRTLPKDAGIKVCLEQGIATVDLPGVLNRLGGSTQVLGIIDSLLLTISQFSAVEGIQFFIDGEKASVFGAEGLSIEHVYARRSSAGKTMLYLPYRSGERYYLLPREMVSLGSKSSRQGDLLKILLEENKRFLPEVPELKNFTAEGEQIILDWGPSLKELFPWKGTPEDKARAALFLDSLLLTLGSNFHCKSVVHLVEGQRWVPPSGYPSLYQEFKYPFYLNPE